MFEMNQLKFNGNVLRKKIAEEYKWISVLNKQKIVL